jgi:y4mF family transcriptional regulator
MCHAGRMRFSGLTPHAIGHRIRSTRQRRGLTQQALAEQCGVSRKFIGELEAGKDTASFGLALKVINHLGVDLCAEDSTSDILTDATTDATAEEPHHEEYPHRPDMGFASQVEQTFRALDYSFALRLLGEYASASLIAGRAELTSAPNIGDDDYLTALAGISRWVARKTATDTPGWASRIQASGHPIFPAEKLHPVPDRMKDLIRRETPAELAGLNVWIRERDLARV